MTDDARPVAITRTAGRNASGQGFRVESTGIADRTTRESCIRLARSEELVRAGFRRTVGQRRRDRPRERRGKLDFAGCIPDTKKEPP